MKITNLLIFVTTFYFIILLILFVVSPLVYLPPLNLDDFVVDDRGNVVIVSSFQNRLFFISEHGKVIDSIKLPESKGTTLMTIDSLDNIYINRLSSVEVYALNRKTRIYSVDSDKTNDWLLDQDGGVVNSNKPRSYDSDGCTQRNRRAILPGELLFFSTKCPSIITAGVFDDFIFDGKTYRCDTLFKNKLSVYDNRGHFMYDIRLIPWYLLPFSFPFPAPFILAIMGFGCWLSINKKKITSGSA